MTARKLNKYIPRRRKKIFNGILYPKDLRGLFT